MRQWRMPSDAAFALAPSGAPSSTLPTVARLGDSPALARALVALLGRHGLRVETLPADAAIPGSYWGDDEAGLVGDTLYVRPDTPAHSALHEACHWVCMDGRRRAAVHTDAGGTDTEEHAVCYLQALLANTLAPHYSRAQLFADMDAWGYHFILGSARAWFQGDSDDARRFLKEHDLMTPTGQPTFRVRA